ncbi:MAG: hypothetical protein K2N04_00090 [Alistipes sp.]|nr:hypothetical protein [Alistipes sp.]
MAILRRFISIMAGVFFILAIVSAWRVAMADGSNIWYVPVVMACCAIIMIFTALRLQPHNKNTGR